MLWEHMVPRQHLVSKLMVLPEHSAVSCQHYLLNITKALTASLFVIMHNIYITGASYTDQVM